MSNRYSDWSQGSASVTPFLIGQRVQIHRGMLAGIPAVITGLQPAHRYLLTIDGMPRGVHVIVGQDALVRSEDQAPVGN